MVLLSITTFIGRLHPVLVHLPIGILLVGLLMQWLSRKPTYATLIPAIPIVLLAGTFSALASCITGYLLSISDDYDKDLVSWHMWMGIGVALVSLMLYAKEKNPAFAIDKKILSIGLLVLIMVTGHLGGSLTHGSDYLSKPLLQIFGGDSSESTAIKPIANVQEAVAYTDVIEPILATKCYSCHNNNKQKGGLRLDQMSFILKGGKDGKVLVPGNADASELIKRALLPTDNDDHMPPKEKPQLTESQLALLHWWITNNADATKKVKELPQTDKIKPILAALQNAKTEVKAPASIPATPVQAADEKVISQLKAHNIMVLPVAQNSNYIMASFVTDSVVEKADLQLLLQLQPQLIWLKISNTNIADDALDMIAQYTQLTRLDIANTHITAAGVPKLAALTHLQYLNLVGNNVNANAVLALKNLQKLQSIYLYKTNSATAYTALKAAFPHTTIDTGGYRVPTLVSDTTLVKEPEENY
jgi:mono/diheme cytochrome c family protein